MSGPAAAEILSHLQSVDAERALRAATPGLADQVAALKEYQQRRFMHTYGDLLASPRYGAAARFFLDELYGPRDYTRRDAQFARVVPAVERMFPGPIVHTVTTLAELHALSERLDTAMARALLERGAAAATDYIAAWQRSGAPPDRERQIALTLVVAEQLDRLTRMPLVHASLRLMRAPARAAGLHELQQFLESGFDTFKAMRGAQEFMGLIHEREHRLASALFDADLLDVRTDGSLERALACLPAGQG